MAASAGAAVNAEKMVDFPTLGSPTIPQLIAIIQPRNEKLISLTIPRKKASVQVAGICVCKLLESEFTSCWDLSLQVAGKSDSKLKALNNKNELPQSIASIKKQFQRLVLLLFS